MKLTLSLVVDSTVWDAGARVREAVLETTGDALDLGVVSTWTHTLDACGEEAATETFDRVPRARAGMRTKTLPRFGEDLALRPEGAPHKGSPHNS